MRQIRSLLMLLLIMVLLTFSVRAHAAGKVKTVYKGVTKSYSGKITKVYINGKKKSLTATPVFMKSGAYMGPMVRLFTESAFKVNCKKSGNDTCVNLIIFCHDHSLYGDSDESHIEELRRKLKEEGYEIEKSWSTYKK